MFSRPTSYFWAVSLCSLSLTLSPAMAENAGPSLLRVDWQPGKAFVWETTTETSTMALDNRQTLNIKQRTDMEVLASPNGGKDVRVTFARLSGEMTGPGGSAKFDTDHPEASNPDLLLNLGQSLGKSFILQYDAKNRFTDVKTVEPLTGAGAAQSALPQLADIRAVAALFRKSMEMGLPPIPVTPGATWAADETLEFPKAGETKVKLNGKYVAREKFLDRDHAKIEVTGKIQTTEIGKTKQATDFAISDTSPLTGLIYFDLERQVITMNVSTTKLDLVIDQQLVSFQQKSTMRLVGIQEIRRAVPLEDDEEKNKE